VSPQAARGIKHARAVARTVISIFLLLALPCVLHAQEQVAGRIVNLRGDVEVMRAQTMVWERASVGQGLSRGDAIRTGSDGRASLLMADETLLQLNHGSHLVMEEVAATAGWLRLRKVMPAAWFSVRSVYRVVVGEIWLRNKNQNPAVDIVTEAVSMGIRGTELNVTVASDETVTLTVLEGAVRAWNEQGALDVGAREQAVARPGVAPQKRLLLTPEDAVQWTLYIPSFISAQEIPAGEDRSLLQRGLSRLMDGEVDRAERIFTEVTARSPESSQGWGFLALTHLIRGERAKALEAARRAVETAPQSSTAWLIRGYAHQAAFDLDRAMEATRQAVALDDRNVLALTNLARLLFGADRLGEARDVIRKAQQLAPEDAEVPNVHGFILLALRRNEDSIAVFQRAIRLDPSMGEPHLGLGLAHMRQGDVAAAMEAITTAVLLEPRRSLFLSYWAKMLYQLERFQPALDLLQTAGELDSQDPTPWLYRAIILRDLNRPVEAIESMNRAMALNDNRAVYRSRFLLDRDLAVKSVDLSILYGDLGLSAWAKNKALASIKQDYMNYAGHLFLAGALFGLEGRGQAGGGENQLAQLLQPANLNAFNTFNEYTSFFEKPSVNGTLTGAFGNFDTYHGDATVYGAIPQVNLAFAGSASYSDTDGWRKDNFERFSDFIGKVKWDPTTSDGFMFLASHPNSKSGNTGFEADRLQDPFIWSKVRTTQVQAGYHHHFGPNADLLFLYTHIKNKGSLQGHQVQRVPPFTSELFDLVDFRTPFEQAQLQYMHKFGNHQLIGGTVQNWGENGAESDVQGFLRIFGFTFPVFHDHEGHDLKSRFQSYYIQDIWRVTPWLTFEAAVYYDRMNRAEGTSGLAWVVDDVNPRLGLVLTPTRSDTIRLAAFRYLLSHAFRFDPMDVAGVTIFRNALEGSVTEEADLVWEHEWSTGFFSTNLFYLEREVSEKFSTPTGTPMVTSVGRARGVEVALNQILWRGLGLNAGYRYLDLDDEKAPEARRRDHQFTLGLNYIHPCGLFGGIAQIYRHEDMKHPSREDDNIWLTDAQVGYIFPGRRGTATLTVRNIFDKRFNWVNDLFVFSGRPPAREIVGTVTLNF
jgi:tetratricopeptide (TPR) repeat protein